ncbi:MFS transporter [Streptomyces sp. UNOC14_S4]|uniref:MFS transporter n=1 Tax=Streptomyces sp. UNOC14_S4 TaxID=2872340 RepID=UPI001E56B5C8|nr:MFS transporter [Streptomyces sp. UNOC14_S4]MCC3770517.1 MFS transporter [Streptomyces sp. UNOC14_S4]
MNSPLRKAPAPPRSPDQSRKALAASAIGNFVEWYDFAVYGYSAPVIAKLFFPSSDQTTALLATLAILGTTFLFRPLGGIYFGRLGDRAGRRNALAAVVLLMGVSTVLIGLLPTYASIGASAPILLVLLRLLQGFSSGGEYSGASTFLSEHAPQHRRGMWAGMSAATTTLPFTAAALVVLSLSTASHQAYAAWTWRIPFLIAGPLALVGLYIRLRLEDSPVYRQLEQTGAVEQSSIGQVLRHYRREVFLVFGIASLNGVGFYTVSSYVPTYLTSTVGLGQTVALTANCIALCVYSVLAPLLGRLGDVHGRRPVLLAGATGLTTLAVPAYLLIGQGSWATAVLGQLLLIGPLVAVASVVAIAQAELFPTQIRYTGSAIGYNAAYAIFGGTAPFAGAFLVAQLHSPIAPAFYLLAMGTLSLPVVTRFPETSRLPLNRPYNRR